MALLLRRCIISFSHKPLPVSGDILFFYTTSSNANNSTTLKPKSVCEHLIHQHGFSPQAALDFSSNKSLLKRPEKVYSLITLLKDSGFSQSQLEKAIRRAPNLLCLDVDIVQPKVKIFLDLGLERSDIAKILSTDPSILKRSTEKLLSTISVLKGDLGFEPSDIAKILSADPSILRRGTELLLSNLSILRGILDCYANVSDVVKLSGGWVLKANLENTLLPNFELLKKCGVTSEHIARCVAQFPRFLLHKPERIQEFIEMADRMGMPQGPQQTWRYLSAIRTLSSMSPENWRLKLEVLRNLGLSENDILRSFHRAPQVFAVSERKLRDVFNIMVGVGKVDLSFLVKRPEIFLCSVEKRLKPRVEVYQLLESKNLLKNKVKLITLCMLSKKDYLHFVSRFEDELGDEFATIKMLNDS